MVKFPDHGTRANVNEVIGTSLATELSLPTPDAALVEVRQELISDSAALASRNVTPGLYFGSRVVPGAYDFRDPVSTGISPQDLSNREQGAAIIGFDNWVRNMDRDNAGNLLIQPQQAGPEKRFRLLAIDFGFILTGPAWQAVDLNNARDARDLVRRLVFLERCVYAQSEFSSVVVGVESFDEHRCEAVLAEIPAEWQMDAATRALVVNFLVARRTLLRGILNSFPVSAAPTT
jgi:hypothetical protein